MSDPVKALYSPALRMKAGELEGVKHLAADVADCVLPRFIVPPSSERDEAAPLLMDMDRTPDISHLLAGAWRRRAALIDLTYVIDEFGRDRAESWLPLMFERARKKEVRAIPVALLSDIADCSGAFKAAIDNAEATKFGFLVPSDEMVGPEFRVAVDTALTSLGLDAQECVVIADFGAAEFSEPEIVSPIIAGALETLQEVGRWQQVIFQGSHYPDKNPAPEGGFEIWPRNEWVAWRRAVAFDPTTAEQMIFGDYAADCSRILFGGNPGKAIRHIRYTTGEKWRIQRGTKSGRDRDCMHRVYKELVASGDFAGSGFSEADAYIAHAAEHSVAPHGNAKIWRQLNTTHHITQVVSDIGQVRGVGIKRLPDREAMQIPLLDTNYP